VRTATPLGTTVACICALAAACSSSLSPYGEALFIVDTDLPVPGVINRLRVDSYSAEGAWFSSADFSLPVSSSWPASFGVDTTRTGAGTDVLVRLRAYSNLSVRQYDGERYQPPVKYVQTFVPENVTELCNQSPSLTVARAAGRGRQALACAAERGLVSSRPRPPKCERGQ